MAVRSRRENSSFQYKETAARLDEDVRTESPSKRIRTVARAPPAEVLPRDRSVSVFCWPRCPLWSPFGTAFGRGAEHALDHNLIATRTLRESVMNLVPGQPARSPATFLTACADHESNPRIVRHGPAMRVAASAIIRHTRHGLPTLAKRHSVAWGRCALSVKVGCVVGAIPSPQSSFRAGGNPDCREIEQLIGRRPADQRRSSRRRAGAGGVFINCSSSQRINVAGSLGMPASGGGANRS